MTEIKRKRKCGAECERYHACLLVLTRESFLSTLKNYTTTGLADSTMDKYMAIQSIRKEISNYAVSNCRFFKERPDAD